jgi:hypothetical protein
MTLYQGDTAVVRFTVPNTDNEGNQIVMTGAVVRWKLMKSVKATGADIYLSKTDSDDITVTEETDQIVIDVAIAPADTETLTRFGALYHELEFKLQGGSYFTVSTGKATLVRTGIRNV